MADRRRRRPFLGELKRRQVLKVCGAYAVVAFVVLQVVDLVAEPLGLPPVTMTLVIIVLAAGFPVGLVLAWAFDLTDEGLVRDRAAQPVTAVAAGDPEPAARPAPPRSIAVLPFTNLSGDTENEYFSDGITEELIGVLSRIRDLHVISRTSVMQYRSTTQTVGRIAADLGVRHILEGSVRKSGNRVRISAQLIHAGEDRELWSERYDRDLEDIFGIQTDVSERIAAALAAELSPQERARIGRRPTTDVRAYELYLKGRYLWGRRTEDGVRRSLDYFQQALDLDPRFALADVGMADAWVILGLYGLEAPSRAMPSAREAAARALGLDPRLSEALTSLATVRALYEWDWSGAERDFRRAMDIQPGYAPAHQWLAAHVLTPRRRFDEARAELEAAAELDPVSPTIMISSGILALYAGDTDRAVSELSRSVDVYDQFGMAHYFLGLAQEEGGNLDDAVRSLRKALELTGESSEVLAALAHALAVRGDADTGPADELHERARARYVSPALLAQVLLGRGDRDEALSLLEKGVDWHALDLIWLGVRPCYRPLAGDPRYEALLERLDLG